MGSREAEVTDIMMESCASLRQVYGVMSFTLAATRFIYLGSFLEYWNVQGFHYRLGLKTSSRNKKSPYGERPSTQTCRLPS